MGLKYPVITGRVENEDAAFLLKSYKITMERQRPTIIEFDIEEPINSDKTALLSLGFENELSETCGLRILECNQIAPDLFECMAIDPAYYILNSEYNDHGTRLSFEEVMGNLAANFGLTLDIRTTETIYKRHNLVFLSTVRNALDQIFDIYKVQNWRYHFDTLNQKLFVLPGKLSVDPIEMEMEYFLEENPEKGLEFRIKPNMRPFIPVLWRGQERVVDTLEFNSETESMFLWLDDL